MGRDLGNERVLAGIAAHPNEAARPQTRYLRHKFLRLEVVLTRIWGLRTVALGVLHGCVRALFAQRLSYLDQFLLSLVVILNLPLFDALCHLISEVLVLRNSHLLKAEIRQARQHHDHHLFRDFLRIAEVKDLENILVELFIFGPNETFIAYAKLAEVDVILPRR